MHPTSAFAAPFGFVVWTLSSSQFLQGCFPSSLYAFLSDKEAWFGITMPRISRISRQAAAQASPNLRSNLPAGCPAGRPLDTAHIPQGLSASSVKPAALTVELWALNAVIIAHLLLRTKSKTPFRNPNLYLILRPRRRTVGVCAPHPNKTPAQNFSSTCISRRLIPEHDAVRSFTRRAWPSLPRRRRWNGPRRRERGQSRRTWPTTDGPGSNRS